ncbi:MAG: hypothetical protein ACK4YP_05450 [Myxococcota bacterium]
MMLALVGLAVAEVVAGGGVDLVGGVVHAPGAWATAGSATVEGDLLVREGAVEVDVDLDVWLRSPNPILGVLGVVPEVLRVRGDVGPLWLGAGFAPAPWRVEAVDGWDTTLVTWSVEHRRALPGSVLAAEVGIGTPERGVVFLGGLDLGAGWNLLGDAAGQITRAPILTGVHGQVGGDGVTFGGGVFAWPDTPAVAGQLGTTLDFEDVRLAAQVTGGWNATFGGHVQAELFPDGVATPVARAELLETQPGGAVGVAVRPVRWMALKAEVAYADAAPQVWVEAALFGETRGGEARAKKRGKTR